MALKLEKATKYVKPLNIFMYGPTFSGKTLSSLLIANGIVQRIHKNDPVKDKLTKEQLVEFKESEAWKHILLIDTEYGRGAIYSGVGDYNYIKIDAPFTTEKLDNVLKEVETMPEIDVIIIDSMTHFWSKEGGLLEQKVVIDSAGGNGYTNWLNIGAKLNNTIELILKSLKHHIITARAKSDTVLVADAKGKMVPKTFGLKPDLREGFDYECDITFNVDKEDHSLLVEKGLPGMMVSYPMATTELGMKLYDICMDKAITPVRSDADICNAIRALSRKDQELINYVGQRLSGRKLEQLDRDSLLALEKEVMALVRKQQKK